MELPLIQIGNSKGFRLNKALLRKYNIQEKVELILQKEYILLKPVPTPRRGWEEAFKKMNETDDDKLLFDDVFEDEDVEEWN